MQVTEAPLPAVADAYLGYMRLRITEELACMPGSPLYVMLAPRGDAAEDGDLQSSVLKASGQTALCCLNCCPCTCKTSFLEALCTICRANGFDATTVAIYTWPWLSVLVW